jgi:hypothetical protein
LLLDCWLKKAEKEKWEKQRQKIESEDQ